MLLSGRSHSWGCAPGKQCLLIYLLELCLKPTTYCVRNEALLSSFGEKYVYKTFHLDELYNCLPFECSLFSLKKMLAATDAAPRCMLQRL